MIDDANYLRVNPRLAIPVAELEWRFTGSSGPGGQHANTANTRVELRFDIASSPTLTDHQRQVLLDRFGPIVQAVAQDERSQARNRQRATARLAQRMAEALVPAKRRIPTKPTRGSVRRRLDAKKRRSDLKRQRRSEPD